MIGCRPLTEQEISIIVNNFDTMRDRTLFILNLYTGFRITESLSLRVKDVFNGNSVLERVTVSRKSMKGKTSGRTVLLHPRAKESILALILEDGMQAEDFLFKSRKGDNSPISRVQAWRTLKDAVNKVGLEGKIALHSTRKSFAETMHNKFNKDIIKTSKALGHKSILSTASYLSFETEELDKAILNMKEYK